MRVLALGAHPDDVEVYCAGTLRKYIIRGDKVTILHACTGDKGNFTIPPEEMARIRDQESIRAGKVIGSKVGTLGFSDAELEDSQENMERFVKAIREVNPDVIFTHSPEDYHKDHEMTSKLVIDASFMVTIPNVCPEVPFMEKVPQIYFMEPYTGIGFHPTEYVDITDTMPAKLEMMKCHESQITWLMEHDHLDILDYIETSGKYRGFQCGVTYAEGFVRMVSGLRAVPGYFLP